LVLQALEPAALELSLKMAEDLEAERQQLHQHWAQRLERVHYTVERAFRQYNAVEPEHRLVARTLERQWEDALAAEAQVQAEYTRFQAQQPTTLSAQDREAIRRLATDIPVLWVAPSTTNAERQAIIRQLVERVVVTIQGDSEHVEVQVHWVGGHGTHTTLRRPVRRLEQLSYYPQLLARVAALHAEGHDSPTIARLLNGEGWRPAKRRQTFNAPMVRNLLARQRLCRHRAPQSPGARAAHEWTIPELAQTLAIPQPTLYAWIRQGRLKARQETVSLRRMWLIQADTAECVRLQAWRSTVRPRSSTGLP
jgi:hypothetical protein